MHTTTPAIHTCPCCRCACETIDQVRAMQERRELPYAPDWIVQAIADRGPRHPFRWYTVGVNTNHEPGDPDRSFRWSVPNLDARYDLSRAVLMTESDACRHNVTEAA